MTDEEIAENDTTVLQSGLARRYDYSMTYT